MKASFGQLQRNWLMMIGSAMVSALHLFSSGCVHLWKIMPWSLSAGAIAFIGV